MSESKSPFATGSGNIPKSVRQRSNSMPQSPLAEPSSFDPVDDPALAARIAEIEAQRVNFGEFGTRMHAQQRPGYVRRFVNDTSKGRVDILRKRGWELVQDDEGKPIQLPAGTREEGGRLSAYLMEIPEVIYNRDDMKKQERQDDIDQAIYDGSHNEEKDDKRYMPRNTTSIRVNNQTPRR